MLDLSLLVLPLLVLCVAYILITRTLYVGMDVGKNARLQELSGGGGVGIGTGGAIPATGGGGGGGGGGTAQPVSTAAIAATPGNSSCILVLNVPAEYNGNGKLRHCPHLLGLWRTPNAHILCHPQRVATTIIVELPRQQQEPQEPQLQRHLQQQRQQLRL